MIPWRASRAALSLLAGTGSLPMHRFERPTIFNVRARPNVIQSTSGSRDLQMVGTLLAPVHTGAAG